MDKNGKILSFEEKPILNNILVSIGIYIFNHQIIDYLPSRGLIEKTTFPLLSKLNLIRAFPINGDWLTVNTMKDIKFVENFLKKKQREGKWLK